MAGGARRKKTAMSSTIEQATAQNAPARGQAVITADRDGIIREWNAAAERIFGHRAKEAIGQTLDLIMPEEERADHWHNYRHVVATGVINYSPDHVLDVEGIRKDGTRVALDVTLMPIRDADGRIMGITAFLREGAWPHEAA